MTLTAVAARPAEVLDELARSIELAKGADRLAPVTVVVPTNTCGVMARRALGRRVGVVGVDMVTLNRLAELIAGPTLAASGRSPMSSSVVELAVAGVLETSPGSFRAVAGHPTTVVALRRLHDELRLAGPDAVERLAATSMRAQEAVRISRSVTAALEAAWYDEADLYRLATELVSAGAIPPLPPVVIHLPHDLSGLAVQFVRALGTRVPVRLVTDAVGHGPHGQDVDRDLRELLASLQVDLPESPPRRPDVTARSIGVVSTTDADDEVRHAARAVLDAARTGVAFERIAVLWPTQRPYARLVEHHLTAARIPWNGRPGTTVAERLAPRLVLDLLDIDRRGLRRHGFFSLVADVPPSDADGAFWPTASWERASRQAGVARDDDWNVRLGPLLNSERWGEAAGSLLSFVSELRSSLGHPAARRPWSEWAQWCVDQLDEWVGRVRLERLPEIEYRAWEALMSALDRLRHLDPVGEPVTRHRFRAALESELDAVPGRVGRVGDGVTVGSLAGAIGLDIDVAIVVGAADGTLPPRPTSDPLLSDTDRAAAGLAPSDALTLRMERALLALDETAALTFTVPRGDLRATAHLERSRWLEYFAGRTVEISVPSHTAGLAVTEFPTTESEHRLRSRSAHVRAGGALGDADDVAADHVLRRALALNQARASDRLTPYDGDLSSSSIPAVSGPVSPSQLETWTTCPHAYFVRYLLHVIPVDEPADQISITASDIGTTQHAALDRFHRAVIAGELPQPTVDGWTPAHREALAAMFDDECRLAERRGRTGRSAYWADERERMRADLLGWLEHDSEFSKQRGTVVIASEQRFGRDPEHPVAWPLGDGRTIHLTGTVDRIDRTADGTIVVTDHKSGGAKRYSGLGPDNPTLDATVFQLPSYGAAARALIGDEGVEVRAEYGLMGKGDYARFGFTITPEVAALVSAQLAHVVDGIESGYFPNRPQRPGWRMYTECLYCEPDELGVAERWAEWLRKRHDDRLAPWFGPADAEADDAATMTDGLS